MGQTRIELERVDDATHFVARNAQGFEVHIDDSTAREDGIGHGAGPMQLLLMSLAGCSGVDMVSMLRKSRQEIRSFRIVVTGNRADGAHPAPFETIHVDFVFEGDLSPDRVERAIRLSLEKYCSVAATLRGVARITAGFSVNGIPQAVDLVVGPA